MAQSVQGNNPWKAAIKSNEDIGTPIVSFDEIMAEQFQEVFLLFHKKILLGRT